MLFKPSKLFILGILFLSLSLSTTAFYLSYQQDMAQVTQFTQTTVSHLKYIRDLKDDMGLIDWAKEFENLEGVLAFKLVAGPKTLVQGGNQSYLPGPLPAGTHYGFPLAWTISLTTNGKSPVPEEFQMVTRTWPGPSLWGLLVFLGVWLTGAAAFLLTLPAAKITSSTAAFDSPEISSPVSAPKEPLSLPFLAPYQKQNFIFMDSQYTIQDLSTSAAVLLKREISDLQGHHLLDLFPDPQVMQAMEKRESLKIQKPFPNHSSLSTTLTSLPEGFVFVLEEN